MRRIALLCALIATACAARVADEPGRALSDVVAGGTPVPWTTASPRITPMPTPTIAPAPTDVRACASAELRAVEGRGQGATGWWVRAVFVGTASADRCVITGPRGVRFVSRGGAVVAEAVLQPITSLDRGWVVLEPGSAPSPSQDSFHDGQALVSVSSYGDCDHHRYDAILLSFASAEVSTTTGGVVNGRCDAVGQRLVVSASPVSSPALASASAMPRRIEAHIDAPTVAAAGMALHYLVTLTNVSDSPYSLRDCPSYIEWLGGRELQATPNAVNVKVPERRIYAGFAKERYMLNCALEAIAPHASVAFEIVLEVPRDALGPDTLRFELVGTGAMASAPITFTTP